MTKQIKTVLRRAACLLFAFYFPLLASAQAPATLAGFTITGLKVKNGNVIVNWQGGGATNQLQRAANATGPWQNLGLPTTASSATNPTAGPIGFFRLMTTVDNTAPTVS